MGHESMTVAEAVWKRIKLGAVTYRNLERWVRLQWPRIQPAAIESAVGELSRHKFIECHEGLWKVKA